MQPWLSLNGNEMARTWAGKICHLQAVPIEDVAVFPGVDPETQMVEDDIVLVNGKSWIIIKLLSGGKGFQEQNQHTEAGIVVDQLIKGFGFGVSEYNHLQLNNWMQRRWLLLLKEVGSGITYIIGNDKKGAKFSFQYNNEETTLTTVQWDKQSTSRALIYKGTLVLPGSGGSSTPSTIRMKKEFLVGDVGFMQDGDTTYGHADLINKTIAVYVDGVRIKGSVDANRLYYTFDSTTGIITFSAALVTAQLVTIDYE